METPSVVRFNPSGGIPNNDRLPVLIYRGAIIEGVNDPAAFETLFEENGWPPIWRNGVYSFHHYHATAHEVLGFAGGRARLMLGGPAGEEFEVQAGDVVLLPAGTGHKRLNASRDFLVVGACPPNQTPDIQREAATAELLVKIKSVAVPETDPVLGIHATIYSRLWLGREPKERRG